MNYHHNRLMRHLRTISLKRTIWKTLSFCLPAFNPNEAVRQSVRRMTNRKVTERRLYVVFQACENKIDCGGFWQTSSEITFSLPHSTLPVSLSSWTAELPSPPPDLQIESKKADRSWCCYVTVYVKKKKKKICLLVAHLCACLQGCFIFADATPTGCISASGLSVILNLGPFLKSTIH